MRLKIDENLPRDCCAILGSTGFEADTLADEDLAGVDDSEVAATVRTEGRILITLDLDFANIRAYPPSHYAGIIVLRSKMQDKLTILGLVQRVAIVLAERSPAGELWIVEADRIRFRTKYS